MDLISLMIWAENRHTETNEDIYYEVYMALVEYFNSKEMYEAALHKLKETEATINILNDEVESLNLENESLKEQNTFLATRIAILKSEED